MLASIPRLFVITMLLFFLITPSVHAQSGSENASPLIRKLIYSNEEIKDVGRKELNALDSIAKAKLVPELIIALKYVNVNDPNQIVTRYRAAETLGILGQVARDTAPDLIQTLKNDESDIVRAHAATALSKIGLEPEKIAPVLIEAMSDRKIWSECSKAVAALGPKTVPALTEALKSNSKFVQIGAASALGNLGQRAKDAAPALEQAIRSTRDEQIKSSFQEALRNIGPPDLITPYETKKSRLSAPPEVEFLSKGPSTSESSSLRFILRIEEIYYNIVIEEIKDGLTEGDPVVLLHSYVITDTDIKRAIGKEELMNLSFRRWTKWNEFELEIDGQIYRVQYTSARKFKMTAVKKI